MAARNFVGVVLLLVSFLFMGIQCATEASHYPASRDGIVHSVQHAESTKTPQLRPSRASPECPGSPSSTVSVDDLAAEGSRDASGSLQIELPANWKISEDDPVVVIDWKPTAVMSFLQNLQNAAPGHNRPGWLQVNQHGVIDNPEDFQRMMVMHLAGFGGGSSGYSILGPNTLAQYTNIISAINRFELNHWTQAVAASNNVQSPIGKIYFVTGTGDRSRALPADLHGPGAGFQQLFE